MVWAEVVVAVRFQQNPKIEVAPMKSETVLFNPENNKFCVLNHTAAFLWQQLGEPRTAEDLAGELCTSFDGVSQSDTLRDVEVAIRELLSLECILASEG